MKYFFLINLLCPFFLQAQQKKNKDEQAVSPLFETLRRFDFEDRFFAGKKVPDTLWYNDTSIKAIGYFAADKENKKSEYKIGLWKEFYEDGTLKSVGNYGMQYLLISYSSGRAIIYNQYKTGEWIYYYENAQVKAKGRYKIEKKPVSAGVDNQFAKSPVTTADWHFYNSDGKPLANKKEVMGEVE
jgi:antitoxin component YwqK of YwqJK toxin-antitoxin module